MRKAYLAALAGAASVSISLIPNTANATSGSGVTATTIYQRTVGDTMYTLAKITIQPGGTTGWHYHNGPLYAVVTKGKLTHSDSSCRTDGVYGAGDKIAEESGASHVHIGRNLGAEPVVLEALYVDPVGSPLSVSAPNPGCDFQ